MLTTPTEMGCNVCHLFYTDLPVSFHLHSSQGLIPKLELRWLMTIFHKQAGELLKMSDCGHDVYGIRKYRDLDSILGPRLHVQVLNKQMDFNQPINHLMSPAGMQSAHDRGLMRLSGYIQASSQS